MPAKKIGQEKAVLIQVRVPGELYRALVSLTDAKNPLREIVRDALTRFARQYGKL